MFGSKISKIEKWAKKENDTKIIKLLSDESKEVRFAAIKALGTIEKDNALNALIRYIEDPDPEIRMSILEALGSLGKSRGKEFVRFTMERDENEAVREKAREVIKKM